MFEELQDIGLNKLERTRAADVTVCSLRSYNAFFNLLQDASGSRNVVPMMASSSLGFVDGRALHSQKRMDILSAVMT
jgi:hypothetical protein